MTHYNLIIIRREGESEIKQAVPKLAWISCSRLMETGWQAVELSPLRVNAVCFGIMRTELWDGVPEEHRNAMYENAARSLPVGRIGEPEDGAKAFLYLMREKYSTGQIVVVDGGSTLV